MDERYVGSPRVLRDFGSLLRDSGAWNEQRAILRQNVTMIKFVEGGQALLGATTDGVLYVGSFVRR